MRTQAQKALKRYQYRKCCEMLYVTAERDKKPKERKITSKEEFRQEVERCRNAQHIMH